MARKSNAKRQKEGNRPKASSHSKSNLKKKKNY